MCYLLFVLVCLHKYCAKLVYYEVHVSVSHRYHFFIAGQLSTYWQIILFELNKNEKNSFSLNLQLYGVRMYYLWQLKSYGTSTNMVNKLILAR